MAKTVADIIKMLDAMAPPELAEPWDNTGLQVGRRSWPVKTIRIALDPLPQVVAEACKANVDLLITHHPLIFHPIKCLDVDTVLGGTIETAVRHHLAILCAHTNLDTATDGLNDVVARRIGLQNLRALGEPRDPEIYHLVLYLPVTYIDRIRKLIDDLPVALPGVDRRPLFFSHALRAAGGDLPVSFLEEKDSGCTDGGSIRLETSVEKNNATKLLKEIRRLCPENICTSHLYPGIFLGHQQGIGRIGDLEKGMDLSRFARLIKRRLGIEAIRVAGDPDMAVYRAAVCTGSGSSLMGAFFSSNAQVYVTGDLRYHDAREAETMNRGVIDIGHYSSEHIIKEVLVERLQKRLRAAGEQIRVEACSLEKDPFMII